jgi:hypothetical protein
MKRITLPVMVSSGKSRLTDRFPVFLPGATTNAHHLDLRSDVGGPDTPLPLVSPCPTNAARFASTKTFRSMKAASSTHPHLRFLCNQSTRRDHSPAGSRAHTSPERPCGTAWESIPQLLEAQLLTCNLPLTGHIDQLIAINWGGFPSCTHVLS